MQSFNDVWSKYERLCCRGRVSRDDDNETEPTEARVVVFSDDDIIVLCYCLYYTDEKNILILFQENLLFYVYTRIATFQ